MRVALAAIADDGDLLTLDQIEIGIPIVIDAHVLSSVEGGEISDARSGGNRNSEQARKLGAHLKHDLRWHRAFSLEGTDRRVNDLDLIHEHEAS
jgi:hypothetical protein